MDPRGVVVIEDAEIGRGAERPQETRALEHVANRPIADHVLDELAAAGVREVVVALPRARAAEVRAGLTPREARHELTLRFVEHSGPLDLPRGMKLAAPLVGEAPCIVHLASGLLGEPLAPLVDRLHDEAPDVVLIVHHQPGGDDHLSAATQELLHIAELHPERAALGMAGVWLFGPGALLNASQAALRSGDDVDLTNLAERVEAAGGDLRVRLADGWRNYRGNPLDLLELNRIALDRLTVNHPRTKGNGNDDGAGNRIEGRVRIHETASVRASVIVGPTVIGPDACIADAYVGPYTSIGPGARIEGAEIESSIIAAGASVMHVGGRLVTSVVGREARVFRDFSLPRALRLRVGDGNEVALC